MSGVVIALEDSPDRVKWLRAAVAPLQVVAHASVAAFVRDVAHYARYKQIALVVFDHDLGNMPPMGAGGMYAGPPAPNYDPDGKTGLDAAIEVEPFNAPALVWSWNKEGRKRIGGELDGKATHIRLIPFSADVQLAAAIGRLLAKRP